MKKFLGLIFLIGGYSYAQDWNNEGDNITSGTVQANQFNIIASGGRGFYFQKSASTNEPFRIALGGNSISGGIMLGREDWMSKIIIPWNVGIGTVNPVSKLDVTVGEYKTYFTGNALTFKNNNVASYIDKKDEGSLRFRMGTNYNTAMVLTNDLKVGIGTATPESNLQVGSSTLNGLIMLGGGKGYSSIGSTRSDGGVILGKNIYARYKDATDNLVGRVAKSGSTGFSGIKLGQNGVIDFFGKKGGVTAESVANTLESSKMRINSDGNVGIGTTNTFGYKLAVNGNIGAKEVKVETNSAWPDFVFKKEYNLPTLTEVEKHIKKKGHLQNIPSASEVKKDGFFLGEMDAKLLQKIEELTLYTIQQEKQLKNQAEEIEKLKGQNKKINKIAEELELIKQRIK